jgi:Zn-dependent oligopeptidase
MAVPGEGSESSCGVPIAAWGVVNHLLGVKNSDDLRQAHQTVQPQVVEMLTQIGTDTAFTCCLF